EVASPPSQAAPQASTPMAAPQPSGNCTDLTGGLIRMGKQMPPEVSLGQEFMCEITATAANCAANVVITDHVPSGAVFVRSEPNAQQQGDLLVWKLDSMESGAVQSIKVWLRAEKEGRLVACATVSAEPRVCGSVLVGKPVLAITKTGPALMRLGDDVSYLITV